MNSKPVIHIPNLSLGNTNSVVNMVNKVGGDVVLAQTPDDLLKATKIILPGVGSFDIGMEELNTGGWSNVLQQLVINEKLPILGICLGMQFFFNRSEEGVKNGLGWIPGYLQKFESKALNPIKIPHMGWNNIQILKTNSLFSGMEDEEQRFYFVHSYHAICEDQNHLAATAFHGSDITAAVCKENIFGVQFHPEKSHRFGMQVFKNFLEI